MSISASSPHSWIHSGAVAGTYPVSVRVEPQFENRQRLTAFFRPLLAIPHAILAGPVYWSSRTGGFGLFGAAAYVLAICNWVTLLITGKELPGARDFAMFYLRWRTRALAYMALFVDSYPPFGDGAYPASIEVAVPVGARDRVSIAARILLAVPHLVVLFFLVIAWFFVTAVAWFLILFTGRYPQGAYSFAFGVMRWALRTEAYLLLLVDDFPPFTVES